MVRWWYVIGAFGVSYGVALGRDIFGGCGDRFLGNGRDGWRLGNQGSILSPYLQTAR